MHVFSHWRSAICGFALALLCLAARALAAEPQRPNILYCLADDWAWPDAGAYGKQVVQTPAFDRLAREGVLFGRAYVAAPTCTASRAAMLTGLAPHRLERGANLNGPLQARFTTLPDRLEAAGYRVGYTRKGWGPGGLEGSGRERNPAGPEFKDFGTFLAAAGEAPFCFWFGSRDPHRAYDEGSGARSGMKLDEIRVPAFLPDTPTVRSDLADYYFAIQRFDREVGQLLAQLEKAGKLADTIVIMAGDNGSPFPRAKATCYDAGTHVPLVVRWPQRFPGGRTVSDFVSLTDLAPTLLEAAGLPMPPDLTGRSFLGVLASDRSGRVDAARSRVFTERERHVVCRPGGTSYPIRSLQTDRFHYLRNLRPELSPAGDEDFTDNQFGPFGDVDNSPTKSELVRRAPSRQSRRIFERHLAAGRPKSCMTWSTIRPSSTTWRPIRPRPRRYGKCAAN